MYFRKQNEHKRRMGRDEATTARISAFVSLFLLQVVVGGEQVPKWRHKKILMKTDR